MNAMARERNRNQKGDDMNRVGLSSRLTNRFSKTNFPVVAEAAAADVPVVAEHTQDSDCSVDPATDSCRGCGVDHSAKCYLCAGRGFHKPGCPESDEAVL